MTRLLLPLVLLGNGFGSTQSSVAPADILLTDSTTMVPPWQTVVSDKGQVLQLFSKRNSNIWRLDSTDQVHTNLTGRVPGDLLSDLMQNGLIDDPYTNRNFMTQREVWMGANNRHGTWSRTWVYSTDIDLPTDDDDDYTNTSWQLVIEGIKMGATIVWDGIELGTVTDQFLRYTLDIPQQSLSSEPRLNQPHRLTVTFDPNSNIAVHGRFTACSGGWDWAPHAQEVDAQGTQRFTLGIVRPMYLVGIRHVSITHVVPKIYYQGAYPTQPLTKAAGDFEVQVDVHLKFASNVVGGDVEQLPSLVLYSPDFGTYNQSIVSSTTGVRDGEMVVTFFMMASKDDVQLWWPNGMGEQPLYDIFVGMVGTDNSNSASMIQKRIGFRTSALVTINETDDTALAEAIRNTTEGSGQHGMYFRVNGAIVMARGANFIPMDQLEGRLSDQSHRIAVQSAAAANMNMMRIWGGGMVLPDAFYDACDEEGILLYHDMMFVEEKGHGPIRTETVEREIRHLVRSLSSHSSIVVWNGCNECSVVMGTSTEIYAKFVMQTVAEEDDTRSIWPSSPSKHGWKTGVHTLDSRPNGNLLSTWDPHDFKHELESHGPYMHSFSSSYPGVNGMDYQYPYYVNTPPHLKKDDVGRTLSNVFSSEFGASVMSSFESMTSTLDPREWAIHGNAPPDTCTHLVGNQNACHGNNSMAERNYPCDSHILAYFGNLTSLDNVGAIAFKEQLFHCMMAQTLWMKGEIEKRRSTNSFGLLIWQLNENWPTGGWGAIEYGTKGQRWKPFMHQLASSLFGDVVSACGKDGRDDLCYVRNDGQTSMVALVSIEAWTIGDTVAVETLNQDIDLEPGTVFWFSLSSDIRANSNVLLISVKEKSASAMTTENVFLRKMPKDLKGLEKAVSIQIQSVEAQEDGTVYITLVSDSLSLFVTLTTAAQGRFAENVFALRPTDIKTIVFKSFNQGESVDVDLLKATLRVEHLGYYISRRHSKTVGVKVE